MISPGTREGVAVGVTVAVALRVGVVLVVGVAVPVGVDVALLVSTAVPLLVGAGVPLATAVPVDEAVALLGTDVPEGTSVGNTVEVVEAAGVAGADVTLANGVAVLAGVDVATGLALLPLAIGVFGANSRPAGCITSCLIPVVVGVVLALAGKLEPVTGEELSVELELTIGLPDVVAVGALVDVSTGLAAMLGAALTGGLPVALLPGVPVAVACASSILKNTARDITPAASRITGGANESATVPFDAEKSMPPARFVFAVSPELGSTPKLKVEAASAFVSVKSSRTEPLAAVYPSDSPGNTF